MLFYVAFILVNGNFGNFFAHNTYGSLFYSDVWEHLQQGEFFISKNALPKETFLTDKNLHTYYFGVMPAFFRAMFDPFMNLYAVNFSNLSILFAVALVWFFVYRTSIGLGLNSKNSKKYLIFLLIALVFSSPLTYLYSWGWVYHEVIVWGFVWTTIFLMVYLLWILKPDSERTIKNGLLMGLAVGFAVLSRPTVSLTAVIPYGFICLESIYKYLRLKKRHDLTKLSYGMIVCALCAVLILTANQKKWGHPLTFVKMEQHVLLRNSSRAKPFLDGKGYFNIDRLKYSLCYYFLPRNNCIAKFPYFKLDSKLSIMNGMPHFDYVEGSRLPLPMTCLYMFVFAVFILFRPKKIPFKKMLYFSFPLVGAIFTMFSLLTVYCMALRYTLDFLPIIVFLNLIFLFAIKDQKTQPNKFLFIFASVVLVISIYMTTMTMLSYKIFIWDIDQKVRIKITEKTGVSPEKGGINFIINSYKYGGS